jgi:hypothetical protein
MRGGDGDSPKAAVERTSPVARALAEAAAIFRQARRENGSSGMSLMVSLPDEVPISETF